MSKQPESFEYGQFRYNGMQYLIGANLQCKVLNTWTTGVSLSKTRIQDIEIKTSIDRLYSSGFLVYDDPQGDIARIIDFFNIQLILFFQEYQQEGSGSAAQQKFNDEQCLKHSFIVDNIEILKTTESSILYCIRFTGYEYESLLNQVTYSDYGEKKEEKLDLIGMLKKILASYGKKKIDNSFNSVYSGLTFEYISGGNDTVQTAVDYLMQKQFFFPQARDNGIKMLTYNILDDSYGMFQPGISKSGQLRAVFYSVNDTQFSEFISRDKVRFASKSSFRRSDIIRPMSDIVMRDYSIESNGFEMSNVKSSQLVNFFGNGNISKLSPIVNSDDLNIVRECSTWNNDTNLYKDFIDMLMNCDSILVETGGCISTTLMSIMNITVDNRTDVMDKTTKQAQEDYSRFSQLCGAWYITGITHVIKPAKEIYNQILQLSRINVTG